MIYGQNTAHLIRDVTDLIGVRTLILRQYWQVTSANASQADVDAATPSAPGTSGGMLIMGTQTLKERGRYATIWTYQGINGDGKSVTFKDRGNSLDYGFDPGFSQVPIHAHRDFLDLLEKYKGYPSNDGTTVIWPPDLEAKPGGGLSLGSQAPETNPMYGIQEYFEMEGVYRYRYASRTLPGSLHAGVGFIASSLPGDPPTTDDGRNWLKAPTAFQRKGYIYDITEFYWLSRRGGWPAPVYAKGSGGRNENPAGLIGGSLVSRTVVSL